MSGPGSLYELALSVPWCITGEALEAMLSIAAREPMPEDEIARRIHGPKSLALRGGQRRDDSGRMTMQGPIAVIPIDGPIYRYADMFTRMSGGVTTESLARDLQTALDDPSVAGIVLAIDSPGGEATGINELSDTIYAARGTKPIVSYIEGYGASAAYWIASAAELVVVDDNALIGSIGTVFGVPDPTKRPSYRIEIVSKQSPKKRPDVTTAEGRAVIQQIADDMTEVFIAKVARNRSIDPAQILAVEGGLLVGQQAIEAGLADALGSEEGAIGALLMGALPAPLRQRRADLKPRIGAPRATQQENVMPPETTDKKPGFWAWITGTPETAAPPTASEQTPPDSVLRAYAAAPLQQTAAAAQSDPEKDELRKQLAAMQAERITERAEAFTKATIASGHAYATEAEALTALYIKAAQADAAQPELGLVTALTAAYTARPANRLAGNLLPNQLPEGSQVLANNAGDGEEQELARVRANAEKYAKRANGTKPRA